MDRSRNLMGHLQQGRGKDRVSATPSPRTGAVRSPTLTLC